MRGGRSSKFRGVRYSGRDDNDRDNDNNWNIGNNEKDIDSGKGWRRGSENYNGNVVNADSGMRRG